VACGSRGVQCLLRDPCRALPCISREANAAWVGATTLRNPGRGTLQVYPDASDGPAMCVVATEGRTIVLELPDRTRSGGGVPLSVRPNQLRPRDAALRR
jgi:hypothetical protein